MKLQNLSDEELIKKKQSLLDQLKTARGCTRRDIHKALERIESERLRRAWKGENQ